jgi:hypothetical protein
MDSIDYDNIIKKIEELTKEDYIGKQEYYKKYPSDVPNQCAYNAFITGFSFENSFEPKVGNCECFFETPNEKMKIWTYKKNTNSVMVSEVNPSIKELDFWKNVAFVIDLALSLSACFELVSENDSDYKWMYYFDENKENFDNIVFNNLDEFGHHNLFCGRHLKLTDISNIANIIELLLRDDKAYIAISLLKLSFLSHQCCFICEMSKKPYYHDHLIFEPKCWEHAVFIPTMEIATVQACRTVEGLLGDPPNRKNKNGLIRHKKKWEELLKINPDDIYEKNGMSYIEFYYYLIDDLRNPSAHNNGIINFELKRKKVVEAQCFAVKIAIEYFKTNMLDLRRAKKKLKFNEKLLKRVKKNMSTKMTDKF